MFVMGGDSGFSVCIFSCVGSSDYPMGLVGKLPNKTCYEKIKYIPYKRVC